MFDVVVIAALSDGLGIIWRRADPRWEFLRSIPRKWLAVGAFFFIIESSIKRVGS